ncbi:MAG: site-specific integrase [Planctomycetes bacterium]|nr:site-specific integrase [Planctomycetota bacterium]
MRLCKAYYKDRDGRKRQSKRWYIELTDHCDRSRRIPAFEDKRASSEFGRKLETLVSLCVAGDRPSVAMVRWLEGLPTTIRKRLARIGLVDGHRVASTKPLTEHIDDYEQSLRDSGATSEYVKKTINRVRTIGDGIGARFLTDLSAAAVSRYLAERRGGKDGKTRTLGAKSSNHYLAAAKAFCNWLVRERRLTESPIAHLSSLNAAADRKHVRRALEPDELRKLLEGARCGPERFGMTGNERGWLYRLAVETGLRSGELRSLTRASFDLGRSDPTVTIGAASAKNGKAATLPLRPDTAAELHAFIGQMIPTASVFKMPRPENVVRMLRGDLDAAEIPYADDTGRVADFHALRSTFASLLLNSGVDVRTAKDLMRHSTIAMTGDVYACTFRGTMSEAVQRLPSFAPSAGEQAKATGTDSVLPDSLPEKRTIPLKGVRGSAPQPESTDEAQPLGKTGTYGDCERIKTQGGASSTAPPKPPPRGLEPLSSG